MSWLNENFQWALVAMLVFIIVWIVAFVVRNNRAKVDKSVESENEKNVRGSAPPRKSNKN